MLTESDGSRREDEAEGTARDMQCEMRKRDVRCVMKKFLKMVDICYVGIDMQHIRI